MDIISARKAFDLGLTRYFTGKPCKWGHTVERMISNGMCAACLATKDKKRKKEAAEYLKVWRLKNPGARTEEGRKYRAKYPEKVATNSKRWRENNLELCRKRGRENAKRLRAINPEKEKARIAKFKVKAELKRIAEAGRSKPKVCEVCSEMNIRIVFDHCHQNGKFRGWLCDRCNKVLGLLKDNADLFKALATYLENKK